MLQRLAADVQRDVRGINNTTNEAEIVRQKLRALLHDQHVGAIKRKPPLVILAVQIQRRAARNKQQRVVLERTLGTEADSTRRVLEVVERRSCRTRRTPPGRPRTACAFSRWAIMELMVSSSVIAPRTSARPVIVACICRLGRLNLAALGHHPSGWDSARSCCSAVMRWVSPFAQVAVIGCRRTRRRCRVHCHGAYRMTSVPWPGALGRL